MTRTTDMITTSDPKWLKIKEKLWQTYLKDIELSQSDDKDENNEIKKNILNLLKKIFDCSLNVNLTIKKQDNLLLQEISRETLDDTEKRVKYLNSLFLKFSNDVAMDLSKLSEYQIFSDSKINELLTFFFSKIAEELEEKSRTKSLEQKKEFLKYRKSFLEKIITNTPDDFRETLKKSLQVLQLFFSKHLADPNSKEWSSQSGDMLTKKLKEKLTVDQKKTYGNFIINLQDLFSTAIFVKLDITEDQAKEDPANFLISQTTYDSKDERSEFIKKVFEHKAQNIIRDLSEFSKKQNIDQQTLTTLKEQYFSLFTKYFSEKLSALDDDKLSEFIKFREYFFKKLEEADTQKILFDDSNLAKETFEKLIKNGKEIISKLSSSQEDSNSNQAVSSQSHTSDHFNSSNASQKSDEPKIQEDKDIQFADQLKLLHKSADDLESLLSQIHLQSIIARQANSQESSGSNDQNMGGTNHSEQLESSQTNSQNFQNQSTQTQDQEHSPTPKEINLEKEIAQRNKLIEELQSSIDHSKQRIQELQLSNGLLSKEIQETLEELSEISTNAEQTLNYWQTRCQTLDNENKVLTKSLKLSQAEVLLLSEQIEQKQKLERELELFKQKNQSLEEKIQEAKELIDLLDKETEADDKIKNHTKSFDTTKLTKGRLSPMVSRRDSTGSPDPFLSHDFRTSGRQGSQDFVSPESLWPSNENLSEMEYDSSQYSLDESLQRAYASKIQISRLSGGENLAETGAQIGYTPLATPTNAPGLSPTPSSHLSRPFEPADTTIDGQSWVGFFYKRFFGNSPSINTPISPSGSTERGGSIESAKPPSHNR